MQSGSVTKVMFVFAGTPGARMHVHRYGARSFGTCVGDCVEVHTNLGQKYMPANPLAGMRMDASQYAPI